jgi:hypothetical protein
MGEMNGTLFLGRARRAEKRLSEISRHLPARPYCGSVIRINILELSGVKKGQAMPVQV